MIAERFAGRLTFGTAGLRAELGAGPMRMNRLVVRQAAAGLVEHLRTRPADRAGSPCWWSATTPVTAPTTSRPTPRRWPTRPGSTPPVRPARADAGAGVRRAHLGADAGVMVTASHNPPADNGYKVYLGDGAQIVPPDDAHIAAAIEAVAAHGAPRCAGSPAPVAPDEIVEAYLAAVADPLRRRRPSGPCRSCTRRCAVWARRSRSPPSRGPASTLRCWSPARPDRTPTSRACRSRTRRSRACSTLRWRRRGAGRRPGPRARPRRRSPRGGRAHARPGPRRRGRQRRPRRGRHRRRLAGAVRQRDRRAAGRPPAAPQRGRRPAGGGDGRVVPAGRAPGRGGRRALRGDADRLQVDRPAGARPPRLALPVRLRGGARVLGVAGGARQGRHLRRPAVRGTDRRAPDGGLLAARAAGGAGARARPARHRPVVGPLPGPGTGAGPRRRAHGPGPGPTARPRSAGGASPRSATSATAATCRRPTRSSGTSTTAPGWCSARAAPSRSSRSTWS